MATRDFIPRASDEGNIGTGDFKWHAVTAVNGNFDTIASYTSGTTASPGSRNAYLATNQYCDDAVDTLNTTLSATIAALGTNLTNTINTKETALYNTITSDNNTLNKSITDLDTKLTNKINTDVAQVQSNLDAEALDKDTKITNLTSTVNTYNLSLSSRIDANTAKINADITNLKKELTAADAEYNSPKMVGTPTAPTADKTTNSTQIATTAYVKNNLADYLPLTGGKMSGNILYNNDASVMQIASGTTWISGAGIQFNGKSNADAGQFLLKAQDGTNRSNLLGKPDGTLTWKDDKVLTATSPAIVGTPTAPTASKTTNSTQIATTAYVKNNLADYLLLSGGTMTGAIISKANNGHQFEAWDNDKKYGIALESNSNGNRGLYDYSNNRWSVLIDSAGAVRSITPTSGDNSTQIATTAFVNTKAGNYLPLTGGTVSSTLTINNTSAEAQIVAKSASGSIYLYAQYNSTGSRGLYGFNANGTGQSILGVDQSGNVTVNTPANGDNSSKIATTAYVQTAIAPKAPLASPALTGTPTAPTASAGTNNTQIATTAFVNTKAGNYLPLSGGNITGQIKANLGNCSWYNGRDYALIRNTTSGTSAYYPILSMKTANGSWEQGTYTNDIMYFTYIADGNYTTKTNTPSTQATLTSSGDFTATTVYNAVWNDYAEFFPRGEETEAGDLIALDTTSEDREQYVKATKELSAVIGVHSNEFAHLIGGDRPPIGVDFVEYNIQNYIPVGLAGRVLVKVVDKSSLKLSDYVGASDVAGKAEKTDKAHAIGMVVNIKNCPEGKVRIKLL